MPPTTSLKTVLSVCLFSFFFSSRRRHTRFDCDWSSDVCSSDLVSLIQGAERRLTATLPVPGRTRWTVFDPVSGAFYVNIADPALIVVVDASKPVADRKSVV